LLKKQKSLSKFFPIKPYTLYNIEAFFTNPYTASKDIIIALKIQIASQPPINKGDLGDFSGLKMPYRNCLADVSLLISGISRKTV